MRRNGILFAIALGLGPATQLQAQPIAATSSQIDAFLRGRSVLARAIDYAGGHARLTGIKQVDARLEGSISNPLQSFEPPGQGSVRSLPLETHFTLDFEGERFRLDTVREFGGAGGGYRLPIDNLAVGGQRYTIFNAIESFSQAPGGGSDISAFARLQLPFLILKRAAENLAATRWISTAGIDGRATDVIEVSLDTSSRARLFVGRETPSVVQMTYLFPDIVEGEIEATARFIGETRTAGIAAPQRIIQFRRGVPMIDLSLRHLAVDEPPGAGRFEPPAAYSRMAGSAKPIVHQPYPGVFDISHISGSTYRSQVIEFDEFLVIFDAPIDVATTARVVREIREHIGPKPIRYVVLSHFHEDHIGGVRTYVEEGATLVTASENVRTIEQVVQASSRLFSVTERRLASAPKFHLVEEPFEISDGNMRAIVQKFPKPVPHVRSMLVLRLPDAGIVIDADLYGPGVEFNPTYDAFLDWAEELGPHFRFALGVHHGVATLADLKAAKQFEIERRKKRSNATARALGD